MRAVKVKAIRRAMRRELDHGSGERWVAHPLLYTNMADQPAVKFRFQYMTTGGKAMIRIGKKIYRISGVLPREQRGK